MARPVVTRPAAPRPTAVAWGAGLTGFAFGGFFDGVLLHQILQWHHLLSGITDPDDLRFQILADGWFHALMYLIGLIGLGVLWSVRTSLSAVGAGARLIAWFLIGFGTWHVIDAILVHWTLGLHRIRPDSDNILFWDLVFFALGLAFIAAGLAARRSAARIAGAGRTVATITLLLGLAAFEPHADRPDVAVFRTGTAPETAIAAIARAGGTIAGARADAAVWQVSGASPASLLADGALFVGAGPFAPACFGAPAT